MMVRTGRRATALQQLLVEAGWRSTEPPTPPRVPLLAPELRVAIGDLYARFGGKQDTAKLRPGAWDLAFEGDLVVELDEELHFNRYRLRSLEPAWAASLPWREHYRNLCVEREAECLAAARWGQRWTNPSCDAHFGPGDPPGEFADGGAPRWKQRALYDTIKDAASLSDGGVRLARVATHDLVGGVPLGDVLDHRASVSPNVLAAFVRARTNG
jgi:hypothetical protein